MVVVGQEFFVGYVEQFDGYVVCVVFVVELWVGVVVGEVYLGVLVFVCFGEYVVMQGWVEVGVYFEFGFYVVVGFGVGIVQDVGVVVVLFDYVDGVLDDCLGDVGFVWGDLFFCGYWVGEFLGVVEVVDGLVVEVDGQQQEEQVVELFVEEQLGVDEECVYGVGVFGGVCWLWVFIFFGWGVCYDCFFLFFGQVFFLKGEGLLGVERGGGVMFCVFLFFRFSVVWFVVLVLGILGWVFRVGFGLGLGGV